MAETLQIIVEGVDKASGVLSGIGKTIGGLALAAGAAAVGGLAALAGGLVSCIGPASDLNESISKVGVVFGENADIIMEWSETAATAMGMTRQQALEAAGTYGNLFRAMGLTGESATMMSQNMVQLAADLGSFNNIPVAEALEKLRAGLTGESEPLKALGINMNEATLKAEALTMGLIRSTKDALDPAAKAQAAYSLIMQQSTLASGDFARTSDGLANQQKILKAQFEDVKATIGTAMLPALTSLTAKLNETFNKPEIKAAIQAVVDWLADALPKAIDTTVDFVTRDLVPAFRDIYEFIDDKLIPPIAEVVAWFQVKVPAAVKVVQDAIFYFQEKILYPFVHFFKFDIPDALWQLQWWWENKGGKRTLDAWVDTFERIGRVVQDVIGWITKLSPQLTGLQIPDWLMPGSPTPFERGLRGINSAIQELSAGSLPALQMQFAGLGGGGAGGGGTQHHYNLTVNTAATSGTVRQDFQMMRALAGV